MSQIPPPPSAGAGWYPDPQQPGQERYWLGQKWSDGLVRPAGGGPTPPPPVGAPPGPGYQPGYQPPQPARRRGPRGCLYAVLGALAVIAVIIVIVVVAAANSNPPGAGSKSHPATADVTVTSCTIKPLDPSLPDGYAQASIQITNHSSGTSNYDIGVGFFNSSGVRVDTGYSLVNSVPSKGVVTDTAGGTQQMSKTEPITCKVVSVDRLASG
jgi:Protein of unknown function (DUF2510)